MSDIVDLSAKRWAANDDPNAHDAESAVHAFLRDVAAGKVAPRHVIVVAEYANDDGGSSVAYFQAGRETESGQIGLLARALQIMGTSG